MTAWSPTPSNLQGTNQRRPAWLKSLWSWLTSPSPRVLEPVRRRRARLLASVLVVIIPLTLLGEIATILASTTAGGGGYTGYWVTLPALAVLSVAYVLSRTRRFNWGALLAFARRLGRFGEAELVHMRRGALLHDIGKMGVPDSILLKPGPLTDAEWVVMRRHPVFALEMLRPIEYLRPALDIPYAHHEKWDGSGYPPGRSGRQPPGPGAGRRVPRDAGVAGGGRKIRGWRPEVQAAPLIEKAGGAASVIFG